MDAFLRRWRGVLIVVAVSLLLTPLLPEPALVIAGSTSLAPLAEAAKGPLRVALGGRVEVASLGSSEGLASVRRGSADLALSDLPLRAPGIARARVGEVAIAVIAAPGLPRAITEQELRDILRGRLRNWRTLGGPDLPVRLVLRAPGSGVRMLLERFSGGTLPQRALVVLASGQVAPVVESLPGAIGFVEASFAPARLTVSLSGLLPAAAGYPLRFTAYVLYRRGDPRAETALAVLRAVAQKGGAAR